MSLKLNCGLYKYLIETQNCSYKITCLIKNRGNLKASALNTEL